MWPQKTPARFKGYLKYSISDHRPTWMEVQPPKLTFYHAVGAVRRDSPHRVYGPDRSRS